VSWEGLVCPRDRTPLVAETDRLSCSNGHSYAIVEGVPVLLIDDERPTHPSFQRSRELADAGTAPAAGTGRSGLDGTVEEAIAATCGNLYRHMVGDTAEYPIPELRLPAGEGRRFLELGCNWGRWCVSAAQRGYTVVGIDPSLEGVLAAKRVAETLGVEAEYLVADARHLPFPDRSFDVVFSYSVLQHFAKDDARASVVEAGRVLRPGGTALIQFANRVGLRSFFNRARLRFRAEQGFDVRYWTPRELDGLFSRVIGPTTIEVDGFFSLNAQRTDLRLLRPSGRAIVYVSDALRGVARTVRPFGNLADSLYVRSRRDP
jgi:SAM-dependent methyltransferase/uncharacterized protein YbaR (Trm112 family)